MTKTNLLHTVYLYLISIYVCFAKVLILSTIITAFSHFTDDIPYLGKSEMFN